ncbi:hypothetical protein E4T38_05180 [Aureobasidium subglaciale]|nr:hypothetical protein E4T38_05180 [Aureobasidium subglaciale]KAI5220330.1 hypothetical protein E4T40_05944 [Aureobasidium subglaciale]KAI5222909.1 hypothetical protein E4T41_06370 [Aureobasidium subglaciale]KAI5260146.1 hypothetical protein E4T46_06252 [Aureobasidium subglaciale]
MDNNMPSQDLPPDLDALVDFIADDTRATLILELATSSSVYRNIAFDTLVATESQSSVSPGWLELLIFSACDATTLKARQTEELGSFASHQWSRKRIGTQWIAVTCLDSSVRDFPSDRPKDDARKNVPETIPLLRHESETSTTSASTHTSNSSTFDVDAPLEDMTVDWLLFPHLTSDPFIDFLIHHNWQDKAIGPIHAWPTMLRQMYTTILASREPRILYWGNDMLMLYNEQARFVTGEMHTVSLGEPFKQVWGEAIDTEIVKMIKTGIKRGKPVCQRDYELILTRYGFPESCFFDLVFLPIPSPEGRYLGVLTEFTEITEKVLQRNRHEVSRSLLENISKAINLQDLWQRFVHTLESNSRDISYAVVYTRATSSSESDQDAFQLEANCNVESLQKHPSHMVITALNRSTTEVIILQQSKGTLPPELAVSVSEVGNVDAAYILPVIGLDGVRLSGIVVLGLNPRRAMSPSIRQFAESIRDMLFKSVALFSLPMEQRESREISRALSQQLETMTMKAERSEQNFARMLRDAPIGMCMHRDDGHCVYVNDVCLELLGMSKGQFFKAAEVGLAWRDAVHDEDFETVNQAWNTAIEKGTPASAEFRVKALSSQGETRWLEISAQQRHDRSGNLEYLYVWLRDISTRKQLAEQKLADALETKRRSEIFIDMVSHEMRNPLGAILLLTDAILSSLPPVMGTDQLCTLTPEIRHTLVDIAANIQLCAKHQKVIIDEVLTFSRLDSKLLVLAPEKISPSETVQSVLKMVKAELDYDKIQGLLEIQQSYVDLAVSNVLLDPGRLSQVILNLMTNAIKFTKNSSKRQITISIAASRTKPTASDCRVTLIDPREDKPAKAARRMSITDEPVGEDVYLIISVRDTGCGLTATEMGHLFHRFSQASPKTYKQVCTKLGITSDRLLTIACQYGGSGLGLFISRELVELQGGQIGVHSEFGKGSTFAFYLETARVETSVQPPSAKIAQTSISDHMRVVDGPAALRTQAQDLHVLVVEDNAINQKILAQQLRKTGCAKVHVADHGVDALELLSTTTFHKAAGLEQLPLSVILLDVEMPIMDGLACARRIRELERTKEIIRHVPIIGITANARVEQIASCIDAGMDEVVTKPFRVMDLLPRMMALVDQHSPIA